MEKHTHITRWNDGEADWEMMIQDGRVTVKTSGDATKADAADELTRQWSALMGFATGNHEHRQEPIVELANRTFGKKGGLM